MLQSARFFGAISLAALLLAGCATPSPGPGSEALPRPAPVAVATDLANPYAGFTVQLWADQPPPRIGAVLNLKLRATADSYLSLYAIHTSGRTSRLLDNQQTRGGRTLTFPSPHSPVDFQLSPPPGTETYLLVATQQPLHWLAPADIRQPGVLTDLHLTGAELQQRLRTVLDRQHPAHWNGAVLNLTVQP
ncbi:MAG TPA: DUF4384 domain-containing protein [Candidatus Competibacter sp.]|nr:DUF4384 domain-containing protein [Candidatus Competibacter sp.]HRX62888.1 DUF4384 domain-containing protein [Candidatus Competibacter sp.]